MTDLHNLVCSSLGKTTFLISAFLTIHSYLWDCFSFFLFPALQKDVPKSAIITLPSHEYLTSSVYFHTEHVSHYFPNFIVLDYNIKINFLKFPLFNSCHLKISLFLPFSHPSSGLSTSGHLPWYWITYPVISTKFPALNLELLNSPHSDGPYLTQDPSFFNPLQRSTTYCNCHMNCTVCICGVFF